MIAQPRQVGSHQWFGKSAPSWLLICITHSTDSWDNAWMYGWMFKCRSRLIGSGIIFKHHTSYYICQMKSFWLQIQCTNVQTKENMQLFKNIREYFFWTKKQPFDVWKKKTCIYLVIYCMGVKGPKPSTFSCSSFHSNSGCDDKNKGRQTSWGRRQSVRQTWIRRLPQVSNTWTALIPRRALDPPHTPSQKQQETPAEGKQETSLQFLCCAPRWDLIFWMLHKSNSFFMKSSAFFACGGVKRQDILPKEELVLSNGNGLCSVQGFSRHSATFFYYIAVDKLHIQLFFHI